MHRWDAGQYLQFSDERTRPALDLLARLNVAAPPTGHRTALLRERWRRMPGVTEMLDALACRSCVASSSGHAARLRAAGAALVIPGMPDLGSALAARGAAL